MASNAVQKLIRYWERYEKLNLKIAFFLVLLQLIHLYWLTTDIVLQRIFGQSFFIIPRSNPAFFFFVIIDYIEIPTLVAGLTYYSFSLYTRQKNSNRNIVFIIMMGVQVFHIFWLTDEVVYDSLLRSKPVAIPFIAAWVAILIDYLEIPVVIDLFKRVVKARKK